MTTLGWEGLRNTFVGRIRSREWQPGALIPSEAQLAVDYGVARATVNRALQSLAVEGLIERRKRAGTRVAELPARRAKLEIPVIRLEVESRDQVYAFRILHDRAEMLPDDIATALSLPKGQLIRHVHTLHLADGRPYAFEDRWLNMLVLPSEPDTESISLNEWLVATVPLQRGSLAFLATTVTTEVAPAMIVPVGTALMVSERMTFGPTGAITFVRLWHRPGYRVETQL